MAHSPRLKIYKDKEYIGCVKYAADAAFLVSIQPGGIVKLDHKRVLWTEGHDGLANDSYDAAAEVMLRRMEQD